MSRKIFIDALAGKTLPGRVAAGTGTSIVCKELMDSVNAYFPEGHTDPAAMFSLALAGSTLPGESKGGGIDKKEPMLTKILFYKIL